MLAESAIIHNIITMCDLWRYIEFPFVLSHIETRNGRSLNILGKESFATTIRSNS
jgi:hypothetical protein